MMHAPRFTTALAFATLLAMGCGDDPLTNGTTDTVGPPDTEIVIDLDAVVTIDTTPIEPIDTLAPGDAAATDTGVVEPTCDDDPKPFFCPCQNNSQCDSGFCVAVGEDEVSARCSRTCSDSCPNGWDCRGTGGGDPVFICQPPIDNLCEPCTVDANCGVVGDRCVAFEDGDYCGQDCQGAPASCPPLYTCGEVTNEAGQILAYQCLPESGSCNCPVGTDYANDPDHCGGCNKACAYDGGVAGCAESDCFLKDCLSGFVDLDNEEFNGCEYACTEVTGAEDWPDAACVGSSCDQDCDGLDGNWARGVFVSATGNASGAGTPEDPTNTITKGIDIAHTTAGKDHVYIAAGTYNEQVTVREGVSLFGGYSNDGQWRRSLAQFQTVVTSSSGVNSIRALIVDGVQTTRTVIDGLTVNGGTNANPGGSSYAIWVRNSSSVLELVRVTAVGGAGGTGATGSPGSPGNSGVVGQPGKTTTDTDCFCDEENTYGGQGGSPGGNQCSAGTNAAGGRGGDSGCGHSGGDPSAHAGSPAPSGTPGGPAGPGQGNGSPGTGGDPGSHGAHGAGGLAGGTVAAAGFWSGYDGSDGSSGTNGKGGGGGGGGGGANNGGFTCATWGGGGGGGGGGGCGGTRGTGGRAGGGSFGVFLHDASPKLIDSALGHKSGGNGGNGGSGGSAGSGKAGGAGGGGDKDAGNGGKGGNGGNGGNGGHGGGGAGGVAYGLYISGTSSPSCTGLSFSPPGAGGGGGVGGVGGTSAGNKGANGAFGDKNKSTSSCP